MTGDGIGDAWRVSYVCWCGEMLDYIRGGWVCCERAPNSKHIFTSTSTTASKPTTTHRINYHFEHYQHQQHQQHTSNNHRHHNHNAIQRPLHHGRPCQSTPREPQRRLPSNLRTNRPPISLYLRNPRDLPQRLRSLCIVPVLRAQHHQGLEGTQEAPPRDERGLRSLLRPWIFFSCIIPHELRRANAKGQPRQCARDGQPASQLREGLDCGQEQGR